MEQNNKPKEDFIFGRRPLIEAIESGKEIAKVMIQKGLSGDLAKEVYKVLHQYKVPYSMVPLEKLNRVTKKNHQGVMAFIAPITFERLDNAVFKSFESGKAPLFLLLDRLTDVRNFGAIARSAECAGVDAIIIGSKGSVTVTADALKASAGALSRVTVVREDNLLKTVKFLKDSGFTVLSCSEKGTETIYGDFYESPLVIVLGSEEDGISEPILESSSVVAKIPMHGATGSLNVSVAAGVVLFETLRQRTLAQ
ncbi:MAG: 23S rRNA (guanosine(2251)-2'-O)-methyltransferase RlmB [Luteibaculaceae bacterium]